MSSLNRCFNIGDLKKKAKKRLPATMYHYMAGGADDEWSLRRNSSAFDDYQLMPNQLNDVSKVDISTKVLGCDLSMPFFLSPTGMSRLFHHEKEFAVAKAAEKMGTLYSLSTMATTSIEDIGATIDSDKMFQIYIFKNRELTKEYVKRAKASGYKALCLTVDTAIAGNRERDHYYGMGIPPKLTLKSMLSYMTHWQWAFNLLRNSDFKLANVSHWDTSLSKGTMGLIQYVNSQFDASVTWDDVAWLVEQWDGPFVLKGSQSVLDAKKAVEAGCSAMMVSNHGGRQLDFAPAPIDCIAPIRDAIGDSLELIVDGGVRRGSDIVKALALGANACSIGRPYLYGLAAGGQQGVEKVISILSNEVKRTTALLGCKSISEINKDHLIINNQIK
ncbi:alpha-hydroxy acid oxidase [Thalassotalea nanhaiensis]|uniref:Alpha-hydroxy acid oxidase n=1 Tax=Thalassotalea nanhaiensis TaxID=3065648 RepID=A0ABY9TGM4_9GAMM|nr:alpha-hydroxy acid oxidase [Colwelliaceae bacterium SQ345]